MLQVPTRVRNRCFAAIAIINVGSDVVIDK
jgi:hypothetical protein